MFFKIKNLIDKIYPELNLTPKKNYVTFKKTKKHNVLSVWPKENSIEIVLHAKLGTLKDENELIYDISNRLWTGAQYALRFDENTNMDEVENLIRQTYSMVK